MLEKLFTSKNRVKILQFLFFEKQETYLREISNKLKISPGIVKKEIDNFKDIGLIIKEGNGIKLKKSSNILEDLKNIFIKTDFVVYPIKQVLKDKRIKYALIFGSFARGEFKEESDIDLMIIGDVRRIEFYKMLRPVEDKTKREINSTVLTTEELTAEKRTGFIKDVFNKKVIMLKGDENELRKIIR